MAEQIICPVKAETIGEPVYLRWVQFCESHCPFARNKSVCDHTTTEIPFPLDSKRMDASRADEVVAAWETYNSF